MKKLKPEKGDAQKKRSGREVCGPVVKSVESVLRLEGSLVEQICERGRSRGGSERERERELWMVRLLS